MWIRTPMLEVHLKSFECKRLNLLESFWHGPYTSLLYSLWPLFFVTIVLCWFLFSLFLGVALHNIHAFHSRFFCFVISLQNKKVKKKREKGSKMCFALFSWIWNQGWPIYFYITCLCTLFSLDELTYCTLLVEAL